MEKFPTERKIFQKTRAPVREKWEEMKEQSLKKEIKKYVLESTNEGAVYKWLENNRNFNSDKIMKETGLSREEVMKIMIELSKSGLIETTITNKRIFINKTHPEKLNELFGKITDGRIYNLIDEKPGLNISQIIKLLNSQHFVVRDKLDKLISSSFIKFKKSPLTRKGENFFTMDYLEKIIKERRKEIRV